MRSVIALTIVALIIGSASAFLVPTSSRNLSIQKHRTPTSFIATAPAVKGKNSVAIFAKGKKKTEAEDLPKADYGKIALMFVNPLNPYSWFVYFFVGIYVFAALK